MFQYFSRDTFVPRREVIRTWQRENTQDESLKLIQINTNLLYGGEFKNENIRGRIHSEILVLRVEHLCYLWQEKGGNYARKHFLEHVDQRDS